MKKYEKKNKKKKAEKTGVRAKAALKKSGPEKRGRKPNPYAKTNRALIIEIKKDFTKVKRFSRKLQKHALMLQAEQTVLMKELEASLVNLKACFKKKK